MLDIRNTCVAVYRPEIVTAQAIEDAIQKCREIISILTLEVWVPVEAYQADREWLRPMGFGESGIASDGGRTYMKFRTTIRRSGDGRAAGVSWEM
jgi:hypothetical protein